MNKLLILFAIQLGHQHAGALFLWQHRNYVSFENKPTYALDESEQDFKQRLARMWHYNQTKPFKKKNITISCEYKNRPKIFQQVGADRPKLFWRLDHRKFKQLSQNGRINVTNFGVALDLSALAVTLQWSKWNESSNGFSLVQTLLIYLTKQKKTIAETVIDNADGITHLAVSQHGRLAALFVENNGERRIDIYHTRNQKLETNIIANISAKIHSLDFNKQATHIGYRRNKQFRIWQLHEDLL